MAMTPAGSSRKAAIVIANTIAEMENVVDFVERFGADHAIPQGVIDNMNLCLNELLNNTISYGYDDREAHDITVELSLAGDALIAEIRDDGCPSIPEKPHPRPSTEGSAVWASIS